MSAAVEQTSEPLIDPIRLEIIRTGLQSIPDLVEVDLMRTAYSPLIYEYKDYAVGLVDAEGRSIALARHGLPGFLTNVLGLAVRDGLALYGADRIEPGDAIITNYAGTMGQHLNNVIMYTPIFGAGGRLIAFMAVNVHWIDIGGRYPGSASGTDTTELIQEGLHLRTVKLYRRGRRVEEIFRVIAYNSRQPDALLGDVDAQYAGCIKGRQLFEQLIARHGECEVFAAIRQIWRDSETAARTALAAAPEGVYEMDAFMDDDGVERGKRIPVHVKVTIEGGSFTVDYTGCGAQVRGPYNSGFFGGADASARVAFKYLFLPEEPANEGTFSPVKVIAPPGTFISANATAPIARYQTPLSTLIDSIIAAVAPALPERVAAGHHGALGVWGFNGINPRTGRFFHFFDSAHGGWGGSAHGDGVGPYKTIRHADNKDIPVETVEALYPVRVEQYSWREGSGGAGRHRGGLGTNKIFRVLAPLRGHISFERHHCPPWGLMGGRDGAPAYTEIESEDGFRRMILKESNIPYQAGDRLCVHTGGGGGYGPALERAPEVVARDVRLGYISAAQAAEQYGVVTTAQGEVDLPATSARRAELRGQAQQRDAAP